MPTVSVIIPTWNRADTLKRAVVSVLNQTYPVTEILVCDDGSTDNSKQVILELNDARIKWCGGARAGMPSVPRNRGIAASKGEWLAFLDSDDEWLPHKIEKQIHAAGKLNTDAVCSNAFHVTSTGVSKQLFSGYDKEIITFSDLLKSNYVICSTSIIKRSLISVVKGFPEAKEMNSIEDYALWLRVATQTDFAFVNEPLASYFDIASQTTIRSNYTDTWDQRIQIFSNLVGWLKSEDSIKKSKYYPLAKLEFRKAMKMRKKSMLLYTIKQFFLEKR
jgi:glycosyltransferase involved in cell wall biosynthesis